MASLYTVNRQDVHGSWRVQQGVIATGTDGCATITNAVDTGFETVIFAVAANKAYTIMKSAGKIYLATAASNITVQVIVFGV